MGRKLKIAAIQLDCTPTPVAKRLAQTATLITEAAQKGAQLVVLPELFNTGYEYHERNYALAEPIDGETVTWMKAQAAQHQIHLAGTLLLRDEADVYDAALLIAPNGRTWRYDKHYVPFWERAYFRGGDQITIADTDLGKLGMLICWDQYHPDLWDEYAGQVDAMVIMSCPGDVASGSLIFPDGYCAPFVNLIGQEPSPPPSNMPTNAVDRHQQAAWMGIPLVEASASGIIRTKLPLIETFFPGSPLAHHTDQAAQAVLECGFQPASRVVNAQGDVLARGTITGNNVVLAEVELPDTVSKPNTAQPDMHIPPEMYHLSDVLVPALMVPLYKAGLRREWGDHMAPD